MVYLVTCLFADTVQYARFRVSSGVFPIYIVLLLHKLCYLFCIHAVVAGIFCTFFCLFGVFFWFEFVAFVFVHVYRSPAVVNTVVGMSNNLYTPLLHYTFLRQIITFWTGAYCNVCVKMYFQRSRCMFIQK